MDYPSDENFGITVSYLLDLASRAYDLFKSSDVDRKRMLLNFVGSNFKLEGKKVLYNYKKPFEAFAVCSESNEWLPRLESIARYFAFEKGAYCPNLRLEERMARGSDEWIMMGADRQAKKKEAVLV